MKITLACCLGDSEAEAFYDFEVPEIPRPGDYICVYGPEERCGRQDFIVRRTWWHLEFDHMEGSGKIDKKGIMVECEFALSPYSSLDHKERVKQYNVKKLDDTVLIGSLPLHPPSSVMPAN